MLKYIFLILLILVFLAELDRTYIIYHDPYDFYIKHFPYQIIYGIINIIIRDFIFLNKYKFESKHMANEIFLENNKNRIINEIKKVNIMKISKATYKVNTLLPKNESYRIIMFKKFNEINVNMLKIFPTIKEYIEKNENVKTCFMSIMSDKTIVDWHRGSTNIYLRHHFPLILDKNYDCHLEIYNDKIDYAKPFLFDDTHPHRLIKNDRKLRIVLISDIWNSYIFNLKSII